MKKLLMGIIFWMLAAAVAVSAMAGVDVNVGISLPPLITFSTPPDVIVIPDTNNVYVVPDIEAEIFFWNGWWWRPWEGRWYRSRYYNRGWSHYNNVPSFYFDVDPGWRRYYRDRDWYGHRWSYERIPNRRLQQNWKSWHNNRHWEKQKNWGVRDYQPRPQIHRQELRRQRQELYQRRPEVRQQQQMRQPQDQLQRQPQQQHQPRVERREQEQQQQRSQPHGRQHREESEQRKSPGDDGDRRR